MTSTNAPRVEVLSPRRGRRGDELSRPAGVAVVGALVTLLVVVVTGSVALRPPATAVQVDRPAASSCSSGPSGGVVTTALLSQCPQVWERRTVVMAGEVVGDVLGRGERRWVQLNDDAYAFTGPLGSHGAALGTNSGVAVLLPPGGHRELSVLGGPGLRGDLVQVVGRYRSAAPEDGGGAALVARELRVLEPGQRLPQPVHPPLAIAAGVLAALAAIAAAITLNRLRPRV